ncbi:MAG: I78 family peptidase inhibitor [Pseudomonadota bacterium]
MRLTWIVPLCVLGAVACAPVEEVSLSDDGCRAAEFEYLKWQKAEVLQDVELPEVTRIIRPGMAVTQDFRQNRLNLFIGNTGRIENLRCG